MEDFGRRHNQKSKVDKPINTPIIRHFSVCLIKKKPNKYLGLRRISKIIFQSQNDLLRKIIEINFLKGHSYRISERIK